MVRNGAGVCSCSSVKLKRLLKVKARHSNLSLSSYTPTCFFPSSFPSLLPNSHPFHPSPLFLKFHGLLLTLSTNDLFLFPSFSSSSLSIPLRLPTRSSKDSAYEEHHCSGRKKHFHKLPCDWVPLLLNQLVQGGASAAWQPSPGGVCFLHFCLKTINITTIIIYQNIFPLQHCMTWIYSIRYAMYCTSCNVIIFSTDNLGFLRTHTI